jgi:hypothetical protein
MKFPIHMLNLNERSSLFLKKFFYLAKGLGLGQIPGLQDQGSLIKLRPYY